MEGFAGSTVVCIASGPSLTQEDCERVGLWRMVAADRRVIVVNNSFQMAPWADVIYACDLQWWRRWHPAVKSLSWGAQCWTQDARAAEAFGLHLVRSEPGGGLASTPDVIRQGKGSGFQSVGLALLWGASRVILLGHDAQPAGGRNHWHDDHPGRNPVAATMKAWREAFDELAAQAPAPIVNASRETALGAFPRIELEAALA